MMFRNHLPSRALALLLLGMMAIQPGFAGVSRAIQDKYRQSYQNKALFLKIPIFSDRQYIYISGENIRPEQGTGIPRYKVGEQLRIVGIDFGSDEIKFKMGAIASDAVAVELIYKFDSNLQESFPNSDVFDRALQATFTEGLKYTDLDNAKRAYTEDQFDRAVREIAAAAGTSRETVLKSIAPQVPAYKDALQDIDNLKGKNQELTAQVGQARSENRSLEAELNSKSSEVSKLKSANSALQQRIDNTTAQLSKLGDELSSARGQTQGYQKELANLQRSLNMKIDASKELSQQIADLGQELRKLRKDNGDLQSQISTLRGNLEAQQAANNKLSKENDDLKSANSQMKSTISTLTSKGDSLARQYIDLKKVKENLENIALAVDSLATHVVEEKNEGGVYYGKANVFLKDIPLGILEWQLPSNLSPNEDVGAQASFSMESIDYVKVVPAERQILRSLGDKLKVLAALSSDSDSIQIKADGPVEKQEVGERDKVAWHWEVHNGGTKDTRLRLSMHLFNRNSDEIPLFQTEHVVMSSNVVRRVRNYLQPIPVAVGTVFGFLLFGIVGIFRRGKHAPRKGAKPTEPAPYIDHKQL